MHSPLHPHHAGSGHSSPCGWVDPWFPMQAPVKCNKLFRWAGLYAKLHGCVLWAGCSRLVPAFSAAAHRSCPSSRQAGHTHLVPHNFHCLLRRACLVTPGPFWQFMPALAL